MIWIAALLSPGSSAFAPSPTALDVEPQRLRAEHAEEQLRWLRSPAWRRFVATDGAGWSARFDEATGTPRVMWGAGIPMPTDEPALVAALVDLLERHADLLGIEPGTLTPRSAGYVDRTDTWYVDVDVLRDGAPTFRGGIGARIVHGRLVLLHVATSPGAMLTGAWSVSSLSAIETAIVAGPAPAATHTARSARQVMLEQKHVDGLFLRRVWEVHTRTAAPPGIWVSFVDGETGALLYVYDEVRYATGQVTGWHHARSPDGSPLVESAMPFIEVEGSFDTAFADADGVVTLTDGGTYAAELAGSYVTVFNAAGPEGELSGPSPDLVWTAADATQAEIDTYVFLHHVRDWGLATAPEVEVSTIPLDSEVNVAAACNAYYDGAVHFFAAGYGCNNTGEIADVNYHEWGHGFHAYSIESGTFDSSLSEGAADTVAFLQTKDNLIAPFFGVDGSAIRNVGPDHVYPQDYVPFYGYAHYNGLIFGGAMWDLLALLEAEEGVEQGALTTGALLAGILKGGTDITGTFYEALASDDDDGDLDNGTPHGCALLDAFGRHGLGTAAGGTVVITQHEPLVDVEADVALPVDAVLLPIAEGCVDATFLQGSVHYRIGDGAWQSAPLSAAGGGVEGTLPAQPVGTFVAYYLEGTTIDGDTFAAPAGTIIRPYTFVVGDTIEIHCDDFELDDGGYVHDLLEGDDEEGADDWQWGTPNGSWGDPASAWSGDAAWGNDLGFEGYNGAYQSDKVNRLRTPRLDALHYTDVFLRYRRWLGVEDGTYDQAVITVGGEPVWTNWIGASGEEHHVDTTWMSHVVDLGGAADQVDHVRIGWEIHSDGGLELGGWTVDDVCIVAPATPDNRLAITDFTATEAGDTNVTFTWTNPVHLPVERVVVVRRGDRYPAAWDDGTVVADVADPAAVELVEVTDATAWEAGDTFYAVYASDGQDWLGWTVDGWNAATVEVEGGNPPGDADGDGIPDGLDPDSGGCGCDGVPGAAGWVVALGLLVTRRRRRAS